MILQGDCRAVMRELSETYAAMGEQRLAAVNPLGSLLMRGSRPTKTGTTAGRIWIIRSGN